MFAFFGVSFTGGSWGQSNRDILVWLQRVLSNGVLLVRLRAQELVGFDLVVDVHITAFLGGLLVQLAASARLRVFAFFLLCALAIRNAGHFAPK
ncbi:hypothetical protein Q6A49_12305 [Pseudomonas sp. 22-AL-CL-001]|jgi:hypothetical protein|nr:hypothetical protein [Pseudomonas sp. 22-AL-CL-001]MDO7911314.1 hypothetical protein [Pseudomonas sp. 22-AL-CL-001]